MPDTADPVAAELAAIEDRRSTAAGDRGEPWEHLGAMVTVLEQDVPRLLAVAAVLLGGHRPYPLYQPASCCHEGPSECGHDPDHPSHFEADSGEWLCRDSPAGFACAEDGDDFPCDRYQRAHEALTGEKVPVGRS